MSEEKNEQPTPKKLEDAREKGQVGVSRDLARLAMLVIPGELAFISEPLWREAIFSLFTLSTSQIGQPFDEAVINMFRGAGLLLMLVFGIFFVVCTVVAFASHWGQFGVLIAPEALTPKFEKLNPVEGAKEIFSKKKLGELIITLIKAILIGLVVFFLARGELPAIVSLAGGTPKDIYFGFITILRSTFHIAIGLCLVLALIDFAMQKYFHIQSLKMDMEEIKREFKESEGDPMVKGQRKQLAREMLEESPVNMVQDANAVVVNPTHFAVALSYKPEVVGVPVVLAKGKEETARAMIQRAKECGIPVIRHVWLARTLFATCKPNTVIPKSSYEAVAYVYAVVQELHATGRLDTVPELESYGDPPSPA